MLATMFIGGNYKRQILNLDLQYLLCGIIYKGAS